MEGVVRVCLVAYPALLLYPVSGIPCALGSPFRAGSVAKSPAATNFYQNFRFCIEIISTEMPRTRGEEEIFKHQEYSVTEKREYSYFWRNGGLLHRERGLMGRRGQWLVWSQLPIINVHGTDFYN